VVDAVALPELLHRLLLAMAGRVDDDALTLARDYIALAQPDRAVELLLGCLIAGRTPVTSDEQYQLRRMAEAALMDVTLVDRLDVVDSLPTGQHRFSDADDPAGGLSETLRGVLRRLPAVRAVLATWRTTPAGATSGAVPQRVVLVELGADGVPTATTHLVARALRRAGVRASVEVIPADMDPPEYHRRALAAARPVSVDRGVLGAEPVAERRPQRAARRAETRAPRAERVEPALRPLQPPPAEVDLPENDHTRLELAGIGDEGPRNELDAPQPTRVLPAVDPSALAPAGGTEVSYATHSSTHSGLEQVDHGESGGLPGEPARNQSNGMSELAPEAMPTRVKLPAAVDAKLTDRERNLLRKLHEELAQREQNGNNGSGGDLWQAANNSSLPGSEDAGHGQDESAPGTNGVGYGGYSGATVSGPWPVANTNPSYPVPNGYPRPTYPTGYQPEG